MKVMDRRRKSEREDTCDDVITVTERGGAEMMTSPNKLYLFELIIQYLQ